MANGHGGARPGAGKKRKPVAEKVLENNPGHRKLTVVDFDNVDELTAEEMPPPREYLSQQQRNGKPFLAEEVYRATWEWLHARQCTQFIPPQLIEQYAVAVGRWIQCEQAITEYGFLAKHPTTNNPIPSPYVAMAGNYGKQANNLWYQIYQIVRENCSTEIKGASPHDDMMEKLLSGR